MVSDHVTQPWIWYFDLQNNEWRLSMSDMRSGSALWPYNVILIQSGMQSYSSNSLLQASKVNSTHGFIMVLPLLLQPTCGTQQNPFISSPCQGWSYTRQWSGSSVIPELYKWSLWRFGKSTLFNCWWLHSLPWHHYSFRQAGCSLFPLFRLRQNHKLVKHLEYVFQSWQIS